MADACANPLLLQWIEEWVDQARERNSKGYKTYKTAYDSMKACPLKFDHPAEAQQLHGLGPKLCDRLTEKMKLHCAENGLPMPEMPYRGSKRGSDDEAEGSAQHAKKQRKRVLKKYVPAFRSGPYALMLGLLTLDENAAMGMTKDELIDIAQPHCDSNFKTPSEPGQFFTAWNSMRTLVSKDLVHEHGRPVKRYMLTDEGRDIALKVHQAKVANGQITDHFNQPAKLQTDNGRTKSATETTSVMPFIAVQGEHVIETILSSQEEDATTSNATLTAPQNDQRNEPSAEQISNTMNPKFTPIYVAPGSFNVRLVLDNREIRSTTDRDYISTELSKRGVNAITRALPVGDALWIAKINPESVPPALLASSEDEVILDHIVERKRLDDLIGSIKDGRFHEQKFRLRKSGVKNVTYIVENFTISEDRHNKYGEAVASAIASTQVVNGFFVKRTEKLDDTIRYLARMTKLLQSHYEKEPLHVIPSKILHPKTYLTTLDTLHKANKQPNSSTGRNNDARNHYITFPSFQFLTSKSADLTLGDVYLKMLMCTRGITGEKAMEIAKKWKTPRELIEAYEKEDVGVKERMVSDALSEIMVPRKKIGRQLSKKIAEVWAG